MGQESLENTQRTSRYPVDPNDDSRCIQCGTSWGRPEDHVKVCLIGESAQRDEFATSGHPGAKILNQSFTGVMQNQD